MDLSKFDPKEHGIGLQETILSEEKKNLIESKKHVFEVFGKE